MRRTRRSATQSSTATTPMSTRSSRPTSRSRSITTLRALRRPRARCAHAQARDPAPRHLEHGGAVRPHVDTDRPCAAGGRARGHVAADRLLLFVLVPVELEVEPVADLGERHAAASSKPPSSSSTNSGLVLVELVAERAHDLLERVLAEREPDRGAVLVHHGRAVRALRAAARAGSPRATSCRTRRAAGARARADRASRRAAPPRARRARARSPRSCRARARRAGSACGRLARITRTVSSKRPLEREELDVDARHDDVPHLELDHPEHVLGRARARAA